MKEGGRSGPLLVAQPNGAAYAWRPHTFDSMGRQDVVGEALRVRRVLVGFGMCGAGSRTGPAGGSVVPTLLYVCV